MSEWHFKNQGKPAQKPNPAKKDADNSKYSLTKKRPTIFVKPETPAAKDKSLKVV